MSEEAYAALQRLAYAATDFSSSEDCQIVKMSLSGYATGIGIT